MNGIANVQKKVADGERSGRRTAMRVMILLVTSLVPLFFCSPAIAQQKSLVFMQIADPQMGMFSDDHGSQREITNLSAVLKDANLLHPAFLVICGDLVNDSHDPEELKSFQETIAQLATDVPLHLVPGNHDVGLNPTPKQLAVYRKRFGPDYYEYHSGSFIGIVLDSMLMADPNAPDESKRQFIWLEHTLRDARRQKGKQIAVFQHIPFFIHSANEPNEWFNIPLKQRSLYLALLRKYKVEHVFAGHTHYPVVAHDGKLEIVIVGAAGKPMNNSVSGLDLVQANPMDVWPHRYFPLTKLPTHLQPPW